MYSILGIVHDPTSFQLLYISCVNKGNLITNKEMILFFSGTHIYS